MTAESSAPSAQLPAGRELDATIHERVFGLDAWATGYEVGSGQDIVPYNVAPRYTTDIAAAWKVVEKIVRPPLSDVTIWSDGGGNRFGARFWSGYAVVAEAEDAETAPLAICRAALRATNGSAQ